MSQKMWRRRDRRWVIILASTIALPFLIRLELILVEWVTGRGLSVSKVAVLGWLYGILWIGGPIAAAYAIARLSVPVPWKIGLWLSLPGVFSLELAILAGLDLVLNGIST